MCRLSKTSLVCCPRWCQFIFSPLTGINIIKGRGVWMSAHHLPVERQQHVWYADHLSLADVHHLLILPPWRRLTSNESAGSQRTKGQIVCFLREAIIRCLLDSDLFEILSGDTNKKRFITKWARSTTFTPVASGWQQITPIFAIVFNFHYVDEINHI